ncbi:ABC transporter permease [Sphaerisporangium rubeum]|uniref:Oligopeptide transport system permease protein OppC n=1 Tax=Sphaerisporangium rubeum TaxID=321317 RepID=A0A7X0IC62_9ACTN|nr:ABC transporter permease [Sphaerisporangium rubeum]MBB6472526.1 peptide/nickel transport system permease protein [Sphaerisporangium rubeum]
MTTLPEQELAEAAATRTPAPTRLRVVAALFLRARRGRLGAAVLLAMFLLAFAGPLVSPWAPDELDFQAFLRPPSALHWFGTTQSGSDVFVLTMRGAQKSLIVGLLVAVLSTGFAAVAGSFAGYFLGWTDRAVMWMTDLLLVLPAFLILAVMSPLFTGGRWLLFAVMLALFLWMITSKIVRGMTRSIKEREYIRAARYMGVSPPVIIFRHVLPNLASLLVADATLNVSAAILTETSLSYFGFGVQPPDVSLGGLIADGATTAVYAPWTFWFAAGVLVVTVLAVNLIGDALRDALDPGGCAR